MMRENLGYFVTQHVKTGRKIVFCGQSKHQLSNRD